MKDTQNWKLEYKKPLGRPMKRWINEPNQIFCIQGGDNPDELANNREEWRLCEVVMGLKSL